MSAGNEAFKRVPINCGELSRLEEIGTPRWLRKVFGIFDADAGKGGVYAFGHLASLLASKGLEATGATSESTLQFLRNWWLGERQGAKVQGIFVDAKLDARIAGELTSHGLTEEPFLTSAFHHAVVRFAARHHPGSTLGWTAVNGLQEGHAHVQALFHPLASDGRQVNLEGSQDGSQDGVAGGLQSAFRAAVRSRFIAITQPPNVDPRARKLAANQWILLCWHAKRGIDLSDDASLCAAASQLDHLLGSPAFSKELEHAIGEAEEFFWTSGAKPLAPEMISARWNEMIELWDSMRAEHSKLAMGSIQAHLLNRAQSGGYQPIRGIHVQPAPPTESEYCHMAASGSSKSPLNIRAALRARRAASSELHASRHDLHTIYKESLANMLLRTDVVMYFAGNALATIELHCATGLRRKPGLLDAGADFGLPAQRYVRSKAWTESRAEQALNAAAGHGTEAHASIVSTETESLLAREHHVKWPTLDESPQSDVGEAQGA